MGLSLHRLVWLGAWFLAMPLYALLPQCIVAYHDYSGERSDLTGKGQGLASRLVDAMLSLRGDLTLAEKYKRLSAHYRFGEEIGRGGQGEVVEFEEKGTGRRVVFKLSEDTRQLIIEATLTRFLFEQYTGTPREEGGLGPPVLDTMYHPEYQAIEVERARYDLNSARKNGMLPQDHDGLMKIAFGVVDAVTYLHDHRIVSRDIKPGNFLMLENGQIVIADLALAGEVGVVRADEMNAIKGTPSFMPPEQFKASAPPQPENDVYATRMSLVQLLTGKELDDKTATSPRRNEKFFATFRIFDRSPHTVSSDISAPVSAAVWFPSKNIHELKTLMVEADAYTHNKDPDGFFSKVYAPYFKELLTRSPNEAASILLSSAEVMDAHARGLLALSPEQEKTLTDCGYSVFAFYDNPPEKIQLGSYYQPRTTPEYRDQWMGRWRRNQPGAFDKAVRFFTRP